MYISLWRRKETFCGAHMCATGIGIFMAHILRCATGKQYSVAHMNMRHRNDILVACVLWRMLYAPQKAYIAAPLVAY